MMKPAPGIRAEVVKFDRVELSEENGQKRTLDRAAFQALKLDERVRYILGKRLRFYLGEREVPAKQALAL